MALRIRAMEAGDIPAIARLAKEAFPTRTASTGNPMHEASMMRPRPGGSSSPSPSGTARSWAMATCGPGRQVAGLIKLWSCRLTGGRVSGGRFSRR